MPSSSINTSSQSEKATSRSTSGLHHLTLEALTKLGRHDSEFVISKAEMCSLVADWLEQGEKAAIISNQIGNLIRNDNESDFFRSLIDGLSFESELLRNLSIETAELLFWNVAAIQLNMGCSVGCPFCGVNAPKGVSQFFAFSDLLKIAASYSSRFFKENETFFYWASDPFDWHNTVGDRDYFYPIIHNAVVKFGDYSPYVSTAVPRGSEEVINENTAIINRLSRSIVNKIRLDSLVGGNPEQLTKHVVEIDVNLDLSERTRDRPELNRFYKVHPDNELQHFGIGCFNGVLLSPKGFSNIVQLIGGDRHRFPERQITVPFDISDLDTDLPVNSDELNQLCINRGTTSAMEALLQIGVVDLVPMYNRSFKKLYETICHAESHDDVGTPIRLINHTGYRYYLLTPNQDPLFNVKPLTAFEYGSRAGFTILKKGNPFYKEDIGNEVDCERRLLLSMHTKGKL